MKKVSAIVLSGVLFVLMNTTALANGFVESPSLNPAPSVESFEVESQECEAVLEVTPYSQRNTLDVENKDEIEDAYSEIKATENLTMLSTELNSLAQELKIPDEQLAVSDLFDVDYKNCNHEIHQKGHGYFTIVLKAETLKNFVGLLHRNDGKWELVKNATVKGNTLTFKINDFSPFAIVVKTEAKAPVSGDDMNIYLWGTIAVASASVAAFCLVKAKKYRMEA